jgi:cytochrome c-type biogenesis protein CcsB
MHPLQSESLPETPSLGVAASGKEKIGTGNTAVLNLVATKAPLVAEISLSPQRLSLADTLDNISYRIIGLGFPLLTVGIIAGAVWANEAWGSYWSWDPKETWALITWLMFAAYLHARITRGWQGRKPAILAASGFVVVWVCYLGVNLLGKGLHSYGWFF